MIFVSWGKGKYLELSFSRKDTEDDAKRQSDNEKRRFISFFAFNV